MPATRTKTIQWWWTIWDDAHAAKVSEAVKRGRTSLGPVTEEFEGRLAKALDVPHVVATTSGSVA